MITYTDIYEAARKERYSDKLQPIAKNFIFEVSRYLKEKKKMISKGNDDLSDVIDKNKKQLENAVTFFKELIVRRRKKILNLVLIAAEAGISKPDFENMLVFEKELFDDLMKCMDSSDSKLDEMMDGKSDKVELNEMIVFKESMESFAGLNTEKMGPFQKGDVANIPKEITKILIESGKAERFYE